MKKARPSFLKKSSKKLLLNEPRDAAPPRAVASRAAARQSGKAPSGPADFNTPHQTTKSFFASFFSKKEVLSSPRATP
jgi:hypothetical protein